MLAATSNPNPMTKPAPRRGLPVLLGLGMLGLAVCVAAGWAAGGAGHAVAAGAGMLSATAGAVAAWGLLMLFQRNPNSPVIAAPVVGLVVRLVVTAAGAGFAVLGAGYPLRPVLFAALLGYLILMAAETFLLYGFASPSRPESSGSEETPDP